MKIYTSYFGNLKALAKNDIVPISIARWSPKWYEGFKLLYAAPTYEMVKGDITREQYIEKYDVILKNLNVAYFVQRLKEIGGGKDVALLCYERPEEFCHRHLLADYMNKLGYDVQEFKGEVVEVKVEEKKKEPEQLSLFDMF